MRARVSGFNPEGLLTSGDCLSRVLAPPYAVLRRVLHMYQVSAGVRALLLLRGPQCAPSGQTSLACLVVQGPLHILTIFVSACAGNHGRCRVPAPLARDCTGARGATRARRI